MTRLTEEMVIARTRANDIGSIRKLNVWGSGLTDVSLLRKMQSVEVLSLSVNKIGSLSDFQWCRNLQELYVRRNEIRDLNQVCYLRDLPRLRSLWLDENPCSSCELYRVTVLRALPHLQKLDNVPVAPEEVQDALRRGVELCHPEDARANEVPQQHQHQHQQQQQVPMPDSRQHSPARQEEYEIGPYYDDYEDPTPPRRPAQHFQHQRRHASLSSLFASTQRSPPRRHAPSDPDSEPEAQQPAGRRPPDDLFYDTDRRNANYEPDATPGYGRAVNNQYHNNIYDRGPHTDAGESPSPADELSSSLASPGSSLHSQTPSKDTTPGSEDYSHGHARGAARAAGRGGRADTCSSDSSASAGSGSGSGSGSGGSGGSGSYLAARRGPPGGHAGEEEPAARGDERDRRPPAQLDLPASQRCSPAPLGPAALGGQPLPPPGSRRPVPRVWNSNILSAVLCLIKELDFPSLEVVEVAVRSRMEEF